VVNVGTGIAFEAEVIFSYVGWTGIGNDASGYLTTFAQFCVE